VVGLREIVFVNNYFISACAASAACACLRCMRVLGIPKKGYKRHF
jgi:hypothetical protein